MLLFKRYISIPDHKISAEIGGVHLYPALAYILKNKILYLMARRIIAGKHIAARRSVQNLYVSERHPVHGAGRVSHTLTYLIGSLAYVKIDSELLAVFKHHILKEYVGDMTSGTMVHTQSAPEEVLFQRSARAVYAVGVSVGDIGDWFVGLRAYDERVAAEIVPCDAVVKDHIPGRALEVPFVRLDAEHIIMRIAEAGLHEHILTA